MSNEEQAFWRWFFGSMVAGAFGVFITVVGMRANNWEHPRDWLPLCHALATHESPVSVAQQHPICEGVMVEIILTGGGSDD